MRLVWLPEARDDIERLFNFVVSKDPKAALRVVAAIQLGARQLLEFPYSGKRLDDATERRQLFVPFSAGAYVLRYRIHDETIVVIRVWHSRESRTG